MWALGMQFVQDSQETSKDVSLKVSHAIVQLAASSYSWIKSGNLAE